MDGEVPVAQRRGPGFGTLERTQDIFLSTLSKYIAALGGQLEVRAAFPDEVITLLGDGKVTETVRSKSSASTASAP